MVFLVYNIIFTIIDVYCFFVYILKVFRKVFILLQVTIYNYRVWS